VKLCVLAAVAAILAAPAGAGLSRALALPKYLNPNSAHISINTEWSGAVKVSGGSQAGVLQNPVDPGATVWAATCGAGQQTFDLKRTVELLGPPTTGEFYWWGYPDHPPTGWKGLTSLALRVNGDVIYTWTQPASENSFDFTPEVDKHFKVGTNELELDVTRAALPKGTSSCNGRGGGGGPLIALAGRLDLTFATDLRVGIPAENPAIRHTTRIVTQNFLVNQGPDRAVNGYLLVFYGGSGEVTLFEYRGNKPCDKVGGSQYYCRFDELDPGEKIPIVMRIVYTPTPGIPNWDHYGASIQFKAYSLTPDLNSANDESDINFIICQAGSTLAQCN